jgi:hypothetical protein
MYGERYQKGRRFPSRKHQNHKLTSFLDLKKEAENKENKDFYRRNAGVGGRSIHHQTRLRKKVLKHGMI